MMHLRESRVSPLQRSVWEEPEQLSNNSPPPVEKQSGEFSKLSTEIVKNDPTKNKADPGYTLCSTWPRTLAFVITLGLICAAAIVIPIVLTSTLGQASTKGATAAATVASMTSSASTASTTRATTATTTSSTSTSTTTTPTCAAGCVNTTMSTLSRIAFYSFDSNTNEITGVYPASGIPSPTYVTGYFGSAIYFNAALSQRLSAPAMQLNSRSFTIEFWFYLVNAVSNNFAFFGQLSVINTPKQTLFLAVTGGRLVIGFFSDDVSSTRVLTDSTWYHVAFVYDMNLRQQLIYIDGLLDIASAVGSGPYFGTSGVITIGGADIYGSLGIPYLTGAIDHLTVTTRTKTACEILNDATLAVYFPFDGTFVDAGPNSLSVTSVGANFSSGLINQATYLSGTNSYVQISGLTGLGRSSYPFSIAFWLYPVVPGVLAHISSAASGLGWCTPFIGISAGGNIVVQVHRNVAPYVIIGPVLQLNTWTHVAHVFSPINGQQLYINGFLSYSMPSATIYTASGVQNYLTIGNLLSGAGCYNPGTLSNPFQGMIDEFRIYSRALSAADACNLAWAR